MLWCGLPIKVFVKTWKFSCEGFFTIALVKSKFENNVLKNKSAPESRQVAFKQDSITLFYIYINNIREKITQFWLAEKVEQNVWRESKKRKLYSGNHKSKFWIMIG